MNASDPVKPLCSSCIAPVSPLRGQQLVLSRVNDEYDRVSVASASRARLTHSAADPLCLSTSLTRTSSGPQCLMQLINMSSNNVSAFTLC